MSEKQDLRNALAKARDEWKASDDFEIWSNPNSLGASKTRRQYLENRLVLAFIAGWIAKEKEQADGK